MSDLTPDQRARLQQIANVTQKLDGCPQGAMPVCGDLVDMGLVKVHDNSIFLMLWVEPTSEGWAEVTGE